MLKQFRWYSFGIILIFISFYLIYQNNDTFHQNSIWDMPLPISNFEKKHVMQPAERYKLRTQLTVRENGENYTPGYLRKELVKGLANMHQYRTQAIEMEERGPSNIPGRTRTLIVLPQDSTHETWLAGSSGGGIWKTTNAGMTWQNISPEFSTLAVTALAYSESDPSIIYAGTGEFIASSFTNITGDGMFKSTDGGDTWEHLEATHDQVQWQAVTRVIVDPNNPDILLASTAPNIWKNGTSYIQKSVDGGQTWTPVFEVSRNLSNDYAIEQIIADPKDFSRIYACQTNVGVLASTDTGNSWNLISNGMYPGGRIEISISPVDSNRLYASVVGALDITQEADIYLSDDKGENWILMIAETNNNIDVLGGQGWYDNSILADVFDLDEFYIGGIGIYKYTYQNNIPYQNILRFSGLNRENTDQFLELQNFGGAFDGVVGKGSVADDEFTSVEIRFGNNLTQKAHRFLIPEGSGAGVPDRDYSYTDYVDVPFQVWDVGSTPERQLMVSFRDQQRDGKFNLIPFFINGITVDLENKHSREYIFVNSRTYENTPSSGITVNGGQKNQYLFDIWPVLVENAIWDAENLPNATLRINFDSTLVGKYQVETIAYPYDDHTKKNQNVHPDHHNLVPIIHNEQEKTWQIVDANDGGIYASNVHQNPGFQSNSWTFSGNNMNTTQYYGADKAPNINRYIGGTQDNGSLMSAEFTTQNNDNRQWNLVWGGDGFDVVWHKTDPKKIIVTSQYLNIGRSTDMGNSFLKATEGITLGDQPFIGQFANKIQKPDRVFTIGFDGIYKSDDFAASWNLIRMDQHSQWATSSLMNIEISEATLNVVWAGAIISDFGSLFLSQDNGISFTDVPNNELVTGYISGIGSHPKNHKTVYVLFSYSNSPKVVRSNDLGQSWEDISGYHQNENRGFPNVAVYDLLVLPHDTNTIWVGTEIGIVESNDNGVSWHLLNSNLPHVSVWQMKLVNNQIIIASHGRGVWTYTLPLQEEPVIYYPPIIKQVLVDFNNNQNFIVNFNAVSAYDSIMVYANQLPTQTYMNVAAGIDTLEVNSFDTTKGPLSSILLIGYFGGIPFSSDSFEVNTFYKDFRITYTDEFSVESSNFTGVFNTSNLANFNTSVLHTPHNYLPNSNLIHTLLIPIEIKSEDAVLYYKDVAIVSPNGDYVALESSTDGLNWNLIGKRYDASLLKQWQVAFDQKSTGNDSYFLLHKYNLLDYFNPGDKVLFRFRLVSDTTEEAWGWAIDDLNIQGKVLSLEDDFYSEILLFPNPARETLTIKSNVSLESAIVTDISGKQKVVAIVQNTLNISDLKQGVYIFTAIVNEKRMSTKFIKR